MDGRNGCRVRIDVLAERAGPEHCGWEHTRVLVVSDPIGTRYTSVDDDFEYVRDPGGRYGVAAFVDGFRTSAQLPTDAVDSGFRQGGRELWLSADDPDAAFVVFAGVAERWPKGEPPLCG